MSNGCAPVLASYSAINLFTSSMSAVAGSYSRRVVSPRDENVRIFAFMFGLLRDVHAWSYCGSGVGGFESLCAILRRFREVSRWHSRRAAGDRDMVHQWPNCWWYISAGSVARP